MIKVEDLVKRYGQVVALRGVSFEVPSGQVLGFLGPNGAGKTTTMKILTGFLYPSSGRVTVDGLDVVEESLEVRRRVGYLPENNPLYGDMRVDDYLGFVAEIRGVPVKQRSSAVDRVVQTCGLSSVFKKTILELSKGFRQRVGLAQAMIHDPEILILDEPTSGLDPNQIIEIRDLIRAVGEDRTVILSTHYLQEVEATCNNIMIVAEGNLVAEGSAEDLESKMPLGPLVAQILGPARAIEAQLAEVFPGSSFLCQPLNGEGGREGTSIRIEVKQAMDVDAREAVYDLVAVNRWKLVELHREPATLEHVFRKYTAGAAAAGARPVGKD